MGEMGGVVDEVATVLGEEATVVGGMGTVVCEVGTMSHMRCPIAARQCVTVTNALDRSTANCGLGMMRVLSVTIMHHWGKT